MPSPPKKQRRAAEGKRQAKHADEEPDHIEVANKKTDAEFISEYIRPGEGWTSWRHPKTKHTYELSLSGVQHMSDSDLDACFALIEETSGEDYRRSSVGWHPAVKRKEMRSPDLRYILIKTAAGKKDSNKEEENNEDGEPSQIHGFLSLMPTYENGQPVVYVYEIHLGAQLQGAGLGALLMKDFALATACNVLAGNTGVGGGKVMLTCFKSNERGRRFYEGLGFVVDESSPRDRKLRGGKVVTSDYVILSWEEGR